MKCIQCGSDHERKGMYCSKRCTDKAYRERKKLKVSETPNKVEDEVELEVEEKIDIPNEKGTKLRWCNFCGASIENSPKLGFCDSHHEREYWYAVKHNLALKIRIDSKTIVETRRYQKVQEVIEAMANRNKMGVTFF
jgi:hypothetical protein